MPKTKKTTTRSTSSKSSSKASTKDKSQEKIPFGSRRNLYIAGGIALAIALLWWFAHGPMTNKLSSLFSPDSSSSVAQSSAKKLEAASEPSATPINTADDSGSSTKASTGTNSGTNTSSTTTTNNTTTNNKTTDTTTTPSTTSTGSNTGVTASAQLANLYVNAGSGLNQSQLNALFGGGPNSCITVQLTSLVQQNICTWTVNGKSVVITLQGGVEVGLPVKVGF